MNEWFPSLRLIGKTFRHTPIRDLIRLQFSGRLDWSTRVTDSDLPESVQTKITDVVNSTRLWRLEKSQIADELIAHFTDARDRGTSTKKMLDRFGDTDTVAALMRSAKKRNRSMFWKVTVTAVYSFLACLVLYAGLTVWFFSATPNPTIDYAAWMGDSARAVPAEDQAWPIYREAFIKHNFVETDIGKLIQQEGSETSWHQWSPGDPQWPALVQYLREHESLISSFRSAGQKPGLGFAPKLRMNYSAEDYRALFGDHPQPTDADFGIEGMSKTSEQLFAGMTIGLLLPQAQEFRRITRLLSVDTKLAAEQGDSQRVYENYLAMLGVGPQVSEVPILVCALVGIAVDRIAYESLEDLLRRYPDLLSDQQLAVIQNKIAKKNPRSYLQMKGERAMQKDVLQRVFSDDGNGDGRLTSQALNSMPLISGLTGGYDGEEYATAFGTLLVGGPGLGLFGASRKQVEAAFDAIDARIEEGFGKPLFQVAPLFDSERVTMVDEHAAGDPFCRYLLDVLLPASDQVRIGAERSEARRAAAEFAVAAFRYRLANDGFPETADQLIPDFIDSLPLDVISGKPLLYRVVDGAPVIYSVGGNGVDDQGVAAIDKDALDQEVMAGHHHLQQAFDTTSGPPATGDWVLYSKPDEN